ncbi:hypothetical protein [Streptomyces sp. ME19-01-6]|uniref:hypothetical protein n=1 Tax=Streptomyces sp. ME19-01-6 TaxID=3028686 RepID=UPI0029CA235A|nr:hypothetical protein [Streptomyces sp. ME19-01-6]
MSQTARELKSFSDIATTPLPGSSGKRLSPEAEACGAFGALASSREAVYEPRAGGARNRMVRAGTYSSQAIRGPSE